MIRLRLSVSVALLALAAPAAARGGDRSIIYFGTHGSGPGQGIHAARFDAATGELTALGLAAEGDRPTWQVVNPKLPILYAVRESKDGPPDAAVRSFTIDRATGRLIPLNGTASGGAGPTYLAIDPRASTLFVANYDSGSVTALPIGADGRLEQPAATMQDSGTGPSPRQKSPHAHSVALDPSGHFLLAADLGADRIFVYRFDPATRALSPAAEPFFQAPAGTGPRHIAFSRDGRTLFVNSELSGEISAYRWDAAAGRLSLIETLPLFPADYAGQRSAAELVPSADGRFLYVSTRGDDSIVAFAIDAASGRLSQRQRIAAGGKTPWSFALSPDGRWLLVANEASSLITEFKVDPRTGTLTATDRTLAVPRPTSVTFVR